jgi:hypothetical protein
MPLITSLKYGLCLNFLIKNLIGSLFPFKAKLIKWIFAQPYLILILEAQTREIIFFKSLKVFE